MALPFGDNVFTKFFTPKEYQVELLEAAKKNNIIACIESVTTKTFVSLKLIHELDTIFRKNKKKKYALFVVESSQNAAHYGSAIKYSSGLKLFDLMQQTFPINEYVLQMISKAQVILATSAQMWELISNNFILVEEVYLLVVDDCHYSTIQHHSMRKLMNHVRLEAELRVFGMMFPVYTMPNLNPGIMEAALNELQSIMHCRIETASDIVSILRYNSKPMEYLIECDIRLKDDLDKVIRAEVNETVNFLQEHRYDPSEIYDGELLEELRSIPDPVAEPLNIINDFIDVFNTMGAWCANKAALSSLFIIEKLKLKTPYERHYLLLCVVSSLMLKTRTIFEACFSQHNESDQVYKFVSPKVRKLIKILKCHKPSKRPDSISTIEESSDAEITNNLKKETTLNVTNNRNPVETKDSNENLSTQFTLCDSYIKYKNDKVNRWRNKKKCPNRQPIVRSKLPVDDEFVCCVIFVKTRLVAAIIHYLLSDLKKIDNDNFWWVSPQFTPEKTADPDKEPRDAEMQHRNLEEVLRKFRTRDCNILIGMSILEEGIDLPKCNLVIRFDTPCTFRSYVYSKSKANANNAWFFMLYELPQKNEFIRDLATYYEIEQLLLKRCSNRVESDESLQEADLYSESVVPYSPSSDEGTTSFVCIDNAIAYVNRYCAKLPSDSFTRLTPIWTTNRITFDNSPSYVTTIRLPINSPYKKEIRGHPMPTKVLSKRIAALEACRLLHIAGELDDNLQPIGKESFHLLFISEDVCLDEIDQLQAVEENDPRPGTNKRRQYYKRKIAECLTECRPLPRVPLYLYNIKTILSCPLPEEQNTRGRKLHPPEESPSGFGILLTKRIPRVSPFPIFIRCGEVIVSLELCSSELFLSEEQLEIISSFLGYTFSKVLKLNKFFMAFDSNSAPSTYFIVPTTSYPGGDVSIDWEFLEKIFRDEKQELTIVPNERRKEFKFSDELYGDAVVMPWYRNQEFPQHFYVAEICWNLSPRSQFPGAEYKTFEEYYFRKYQIKIQNLNQPLLDVDHTSARLNFLTPRYVNRKGVALPTCSEATKKAKRESLEQKQILVPELCQIHLFPASLWRKAVALPCILYRLNCLLLAEEIRSKVSREMNLGLDSVPDDYEWPSLNFGWTLADVIRRTRELKEMNVQQNNDSKSVSEEDVQTITAEKLNANDDYSKKLHDIEQVRKNVCNIEVLSEGEPLMEIGTWSNEMASGIQTFISDIDSHYGALNDISKDARYGSPTSWLTNNDDDDTDMDSSSASESSFDAFENSPGIRIEFRNEFLAEAIDKIEQCNDLDDVHAKCTWQWECSVTDDCIKKEIEQFEKAVQRHEKRILASGRIINKADDISTKPYVNRTTENETVAERLFLPWSLTPESGYGLPNVEEMKIADYSCEDLCMFFEECHTTGDEFNRCYDFAENEIFEEGTFSFDYQPNLQDHVGPGPGVLLQALTMSNANDGINLERLETIGDSFLKYAITNYLYCTYNNVHEGKLSHIRSKQVSNLHLYKLGKNKVFGESMVACKFEPHDNWLPPCFRIPFELEKALIENKASSCYWKVSDLPALWNVKCEDISFTKKIRLDEDLSETDEAALTHLPFHLITYQNIPDKSIADCVEALIGAYLIACGIRGALLFMSWLGIKVLPAVNLDEDDKLNSPQSKIQYGYLCPPPSPLIRHIPDPEGELERLLVGYDEFERILHYRFNDRSYLLQAMTHASYSTNRITDCYQRLEFLGDAVLDYLITRHLYEDKRQHSPGALTDLRSALVNNTIFAALAVRFGFHKYFRHLSPGLADVIHRFVRIQEDNNHTIFEEYYLINEEECEEVEDVEVPKALGDIFESVAGAIFLDSGMSLDAVWKVYYRIMRNEIEQFSAFVPKSPIRELLEMEPETAKFGRPEKLADGKRVRVTVEVFGKGSFKGIGRNYRIAKCTAAKCALKQLKKKGLMSKRTNLVLE